MAYFEPRGDSVRVVVRIPGGGKKTATFDTRAEAEAWAVRMECRKSTGALGPGHDRTNAQLFEEYAEIEAGNTDTGRWNRLRLQKFAASPIGSLKVQQTGIEHVNDWIIERSKQVKPGTVLRELNVMSGAFRYAIKTRKWIKTNPCHGVIRPPAPPGRNRPLLTIEEIDEIRLVTGYDTDSNLSTKTARVGAAFLLALETAMRSGEILRIRPEHYLRDKRTVHVAALERGGRKGGKSGKVLRAGRYVPLSEAAIQILDRLLATMPKDQKAHPGQEMPPYIVGMSDKQRDALWRKALEKTSIQDLHFHDMKHEACTRMSRFLDVLELSHAVGTKDVRLLRDTYYVVDASATAARLPTSLTPGLSRLGSPEGDRPAP